MSSLALALAAGLTLPVAAFADGQVAAPQLSLKTGMIQTQALPNLLVQKASFAAGTHYILQLDGPMTAQRSTALAAAGVTLGQYLPEFAYIVRMDNVAPAAVNALGFAVWAGTMDPAWKLSPDFGQRKFATVARQAEAAVGVAQIAVVLFEGEAIDAATQAIAAAGGRVDGSTMVGKQWVIDATMQAAAARQLVTLPSVQFVEDAPELTFRNDSNRWILQSNVNSPSPQTPIWDRGIHGEGQVAGLIDGTPRETHCMFDDTPAPGPTHRKFVGWRSAGSANSHGTHCAGTIAGDQAPFGVYTTHDGLAYAAKMSFTNSNAVAGSTLSARFQDAHNDGARVHSNSWGDDSTRNYTVHCVAIDTFTYANEDSLVAFAVSNGSIATTPENSINVLGVGASQDTPNQANHCSGGTGPTLDGRRKPEIYAPGCNTTSASNSTCGTTNSTGTSMACPAVTAAGILVRQYFTDGFYPSGAANASNALTPSGALIKATLLNSTVDMTGISGYPSNSEGWGRVLLDNALHFTGDARDLYVVDVRNAQGLTTGQSQSYPITVASSGQPLKIVMNFTAPPSTINAANPVINNLDLEVVGPGGTYLGNVFTAGVSSTGGAADAKNNVEVVLLAAPTAGQYTITVRAAAVNQGPQGFALAVTGDLGSSCTSPGVGTPPSAQQVASGQPVSFTVAGTGSPTLLYQWRRDNQNLANGGTISGADSPNLQISSAVMGDAGSYDVVISNGCGSITSTAATLTITCYANCDSSTVNPILNVADFGCFLNAFAAGESYANCDGSTAAPVLNVADFGCFLNAFAAGCP